jgi:type IV pilus biogenesis protein CpaD/CtpE
MYGECAEIFIMKRMAVLTSAVLIVLVAISASGCTSSTTNSTTAKDYTQHYIDAFKANQTNLTVISSFTKSKSTDNNDLYTGVFNGTSSNGTMTFAIEIMPSQAAAQTKFDKVVANQTSAGYVNASAVLGKSNATIFNQGAVTPMGTVNSEWWGLNLQSGTIVAVYLTQDAGADNNWTVTTWTLTGTGITSGTS